MQRRFAVILCASLLLFDPLLLIAKGRTTKIVIEGRDLAKPIEITDRNILENFNVWSGPGTFSSQPGFDANAPSFIIDWSQGPVGKVPESLRRYQVSFYAGEAPHEVLVYVVHYAFSPDTEQGYVYLPGESDEWAGLNVRSIWRGVEGKWFRAWNAWERVARPLIPEGWVGKFEHTRTLKQFNSQF